jgi:hypothetical protein
MRIEISYVNKEEGTVKAYSLETEGTETLKQFKIKLHPIVDLEPRNQVLGFDGIPSFFSFSLNDFFRRKAAG